MPKIVSPFTTNPVARSSEAARLFSMLRNPQQQDELASFNNRTRDERPSNITGKGIDTSLVQI